MRSRSALEWSGIALGAATQAVWCGLLGSIFSAAGWPELAAFAFVVMVAAAAAARWAAADDARLRSGRAALAAVVLLATVALVAAGRGWEHQYLGWQVVRAVVFCAVVGLLGVWLGRGDSGPDEAFGRAARAFAAVCALLALSALSATGVEAPAAAVAAVIVAGGLHVVVLRYRALTDVVAEDDRLPVWPWLLAVGGALVVVLVVTALVAELLGVAPLHALASVVATALAYVAEGFARVAAVILRGLSWLGGLFHLEIPQYEVPEVRSVGEPLPTATKTPAAASQTGRAVATVVATGLAVLAAVAVVVLALRRLTREPPRDEAVVEERESVRSVTSATGAALGKLRRRVFALARGGRRTRTPAEAIRLRYERLEARLARAGSPRDPGTTVRAYLCVSVTAEEPGAAAELASLYELARYSGRAVSESQAGRFAELAGACRPAEASGGR